jgi:conjugative relaxase-like TrwC/TraI family protein
MLRFKTFGSARAAIRYYTDRGTDCARTLDEAEPDLAVDADAGRAVDYYTTRGAVVGTWLGSGATALGLSGPIHTCDAHVLERLLSGQLPDGTEVRGPVLRADPDGQLPVAGLLAAVEAVTSSRGVSVDAGLRDPDTRALHAQFVSRAAAQRDATADAREVVTVAEAIGVNPGEVYGAGAVAVALAKADQKVDVRKAGADGQLSPPKSVSLLWAFGDAAVQREVLASHRTAVSQTVKHLETYAGHVLRGHQGGKDRAAHMGTDGLIVAAFEHLTSRADDPQIHTHLVVVNLAHGADGKWSALDTRALFRHQKTAGYLYQAALRGELTRRLGVGWSPVRHGIAEVTGMSRKLTRAFSQRRRQVLAHLEQTGGSGAKAADVACLATRPAKSGTPVHELISEWQSRASELVGDPRLLIENMLGVTRPRTLTREVTDTLARLAVSAVGVTENATSFDRQQLTRYLLEHLPEGTVIDHGRTEALVDRVLAHSDVLRLVDDRSSERQFTARSLTTAEAETLLRARIPTGVPIGAPAAVSTIALASEQRLLVDALAASPFSVDVALGPAGSGKTAALNAAVEHWRRLGVPVLGAALAAVAARRLEHATGAPSTSLARLLHRIEAGQPLDACTVVLLDEAGMVGTRDYHRLVHAVTDAGGKLVAVGDRAQLTEIDAGGMFTRLSQQHLRGELTDNHRQTHPWQRDALTNLRNGDVASALVAFEGHGRLHVADNRELLRSQVASQYVNAYRPDDPFAVIALAGTRHGVAELNTEIRGHLRAHGQLAPADKHLPCDGGATLPLAIGDLILVTRNDHVRGLLNGTRGQVTRLNARDVGLRLEDGRRVTVPTNWAAERLTHAYAMTVHKAQGLTVDIALVDASDLPDRNAGYVAFSRARIRTEIHVHDRDALDDALADDPFSRSARPSAPVDQLQHRLDSVIAQQLAYDRLARDEYYLDRGEGLSR